MRKAETLVPVFLYQMRKTEISNKKNISTGLLISNEKN